MPPVRGLVPALEGLCPYPEGLCLPLEGLLLSLMSLSIPREGLCPLMKGLCLCHNACACCSWAYASRLWTGASDCKACASCPSLEGLCLMAGAFSRCSFVVLTLQSRCQSGVLGYQSSGYQAHNSLLTELLGSCFIGGGSPTLMSLLGNEGRSWPLHGLGMHTKPNDC